MTLNNEKFENSEYRFEKISEGNKDNYELDLRAGYYFNDYFAGSLGFIIGGDSFERWVPKIIGFTDRSSITQTFGISPALRSSIPVVPNQRLNLFVDLGFNFNWGETKVDDIENETIILSNVSDNFDFGVGIKPGVTFFVMENFALEIGLEILGYNYNSTKTNFNDDNPDEKYSSHSIDFDLSLSTLQLSLAYYIGVKKDK